MVERAYTTALLRSLQFSGVKFLRYFIVDVFNNIRSKAKPIDILLKKDVASLNQEVSMAEVCCGGVPFYADSMQPNTGLDARKVLSIQVDPASVRVLPYAPKSAIVLGDLIDQFTGEVSPLCTRSLLRRVVQRAALQHDIAFNVGAELEFCLVKKDSEKSFGGFGDGDGGGVVRFVDQSVFANTITLNENEDFIDQMYTQLQQQHIPVELVHAESGPGQLEVVLEYCQDPVLLCDNIVLAKETIQAVAKQFGCKALFLPKYDMTKAGNGLHVHASIRQVSTGKPLFAAGSVKGGFDVSAADALTPQGASFVEGILQHLPAIMGLSLPTVNSHYRVGKGCWTGSVIGWGLEDKEVAIRVCSNLRTKEWDHVEYKLLDSTANPYLALGAVLMSGLSGIESEVTLRPSLDALEEQDADPLPYSLEECLDALEADSLLTSASYMGEYLTKAYLTIRRHEEKRSSEMAIEQQVQEALDRC